ncbi:MAG TPA: EamA family transporter [Actinomycetota bacterium]
MSEAATTPRKGNRAVLIGMILLSVTFAAVAQVTLKSGVNRVTDDTGGTLRLDGESLRALAGSPIVWLGLVLFGLSAIVWLVVLSRASLSFAYPFASLSYVLILVLGRFVLDERITSLRLAGVALIVAGVVLVGQTPHA